MHERDRSLILHGAEVYQFGAMSLLKGNFADFQFLCKKLSKSSTQLSGGARMQALTAELVQFSHIYEKLKKNTRLTQGVSRQARFKTE